MAQDQGARPEAGAGEGATVPARHAGDAALPPDLARPAWPDAALPPDLARPACPDDRGRADAPPDLDDADDLAGPAGQGWLRDRAAWLIALAAFVVYTTISVFRYLRLDAGSWDLGIYTEYVRQYALLRAPVVTIKGSGFNLLGDHFQPIVALIAPFYRVFPSPVTLLVAQALLTAVSVVPVCRAAQVLLGTGASRAIGLAYGFSWGLQEMIIFDFHEVAFAVPLLAFSLSALVLRRPRAAAAWALPLVFVKEDQGLTVAAIGLVMVVMAVRARPGRGERTAGAGNGAGTWGRAGGLLMLWGLAWSVLTVVVIIPHFNPAHVYPYWYDGGVIGLHGAHYSAGGLLNQVMRAWTEKLWTTGLVLLPVGFLALRSPLIIAAVPSLVLRFMATNSNYWGAEYHYSATVMPVVFLAAIDALARMQARARLGARPAQSARPGARPAQSARPAAAWASRMLGPAPRAARYGAATMAVIAAVLAVWFPLSSLWKPQTYRISQHVRAENTAMGLVPPGTTVETTLSMLAPMATRDTTYWVGSPGDPAPRYILFDTTNSGYSPPPTDILAFVEQQHPGNAYEQTFKESGVYVFRWDGRTGG